MPYGNYVSTEEEMKKLPRYLNPGEQVTIYFEIHNFSFNQPENRCLFYPIDVSGKVYYQKANIFWKLYRFFFWNFGWISPKYRDHNKF